MGTLVTQIIPLNIVNYDFATTSDKKWLVSTVKAVQPNEEYLLRRRQGKDISYFETMPANLTPEYHKAEQ